MDPSAIPLILKEFGLNKHCVANIYHHGSWVYGTNSPTSDRDLIIITRSSQKRVTYTDDFQYFHEFELYKLWNQYDVCVYSVENFEILLERNYLAIVQCVFLPNEFKIKEEIDFRKIYQEKYYNKFKLKQAAIYEMSRYRELYVSGGFSRHPVCSSRSLHTQQSRRDYVFKSLFHGLRYFDFVEQLLQTKSIHNYRRVTYLFDEMKKIRGDSTDNPNMEQ
jgi:predicted nucleotidyltransferase